MCSRLKVAHTKRWTAMDVDVIVRRVLFAYRPATIGRPPDGLSAVQRTSTSPPDRPQLHIQINLVFKSRSTSISHPDQLQFHIQIDLNFTCRPTSIVHVQIDLNFSRPDRLQFHVQIVLNFTSRTCRRMAPTIGIQP